METVKAILEQMGSPTPEDLALIEKAYAFAAEAHKEHKRFSGEPYIIHPLETAKGLASLGMSEQGASGVIVAPRGCASAPQPLASGLLSHSVRKSSVA